jgi:hypothetical protein
MFVRKLTFRLALFFLIAAGCVTANAGSALAAKCVQVKAPLTPLPWTLAYNHEDRPGVICALWPPSCSVDHLAFQGTRYVVWTENPLRQFVLGTNILLQTGWLYKGDVKAVPCTRQLRRVDRKRALKQSRQSK